MDHPRLSFGRLFCFSLSLALLSISCSSGPEPARQSDPGSPTILTARTVPSTIELNRDLQPIQTNPKIQVDIRDFHSEVTEVMLQFNNVPISVPMQNIGGNTWEVQLDSRALEMMAVSGETIKYGAQVIAKNADGKTGLSEKSVEVAIKAPKLAKPSTT